MREHADPRDIPARLQQLTDENQQNAQGVSAKMNASYHFRSSAVHIAKARRRHHARSHKRVCPEHRSEKCNAFSVKADAVVRHDGRRRRMAALAVRQ
jgi:hypothetical protein